MTVRLWDTVTGAALQTLKGHSGWVTSIAFSSDGKQIVSGSDDEMVRLWDAVTGAALQTLEGYSNRVNSVAFSPDGKQVVSGSGDKTVRLWDAVAGAALQTLEGHSGWVNSVAFRSLRLGHLSRPLAGRQAGLVRLRRQGCAALGCYHGSSAVDARRPLYWA
jgi:WD40 repeat protein